MPFSRTLLQQATDLSEEMAELGAADEWEQVVQLDERRRTILEECLDAGVPETEKPHVIEVLQKIQAMNDALTALASEKRQESEQALQLLQKRKDASAAYRETTGAE